MWSIVGYFVDSGGDVGGIEVFGDAGEAGKILGAGTYLSYVMSFSRGSEHVFVIGSTRDSSCTLMLQISF